VKKLAPIALLLATALASIPYLGACLMLARPADTSPTPTAAVPVPRAGALAGYANPILDRFSYASGTSGTYTVPSGYFVTSWWAHNTSGGGTVTITPSGPGEYNPCDAGYDAAGPDANSIDGGEDAASLSDAGPQCAFALAAITVPAASAYGNGVPVLRAGQDELGPGSIFVFTSTDSYVVTLWRYNP
jgi:hypothetical protein